MTLDLDLARLASFRSVAPAPGWHPTSEALQTVREWLERLTAPTMGPDLAARLRGGLLDGFTWLDALPRADGFWEGTDRRPTLPLVFQLAERAMDGLGPDLSWAPWAQACIRLRYCTNEFGVQSWLRLYRRGALDVAWPVRAAWHVHAQSGARTEGRLVGFLRPLELGLELRTALETFAPPERTGPWAERVIDGVPLDVDFPRAVCADPAVRGLAQGAARDGRLDELPVLADALEDVGYTDPRVLTHLRQSHAGRSGCWVADDLRRRAGPVG